jgi:CHAT domain-containing protein
MHYILNEHSEMLSGFPLAPEATNSTHDPSLDGFLQSYEIYRMNLRRLRLVVLSACSTGIERNYSGEGAVSAVRPFLVGRVPTVVASLWSVDSDASADLMVNFHKYRRRESQSVTQALKHAQLEMLQDPDTRLHHPYYWAPFVVIGGFSSY